MKVLILGLNYAPEKVGISVYTTGMAEALQRMGHEVHVVAGQPYYPAWRIMDGRSAYSYSRGTEQGVDVTRVPHYIPARPTGSRRMLHHISFALNSLPPMLARAIAWRPEVVVTVAPSLIAAPVARLAAALCGAKSWLHVQDFEVEAAFATGLLNGDGLGARLARGFEKWVMRLFDTVSSISPQMCRKLVEKGVAPERVSEFRNWADVDAIRPMTESSPYRTEWDIKTPHVALYSGNIANKQGIEIVLEAAQLLSHRKDITFVVCGEGPNRARLEEKAAGLDNIRFHDLQPKERLNELMGLATIHLLPQLAGAADLVLPSKLTNMLASGRPVAATADAGTGLFDEVAGCGIVSSPGNARAFADAVLELTDAPEKHASLGKAARQRATERWNKAHIIAGFAATLQSDGANPQESGARKKRLV